MAEKKSATTKTASASKPTTAKRTVKASTAAKTSVKPLETEKVAAKPKTVKNNETNLNISEKKKILFVASEATPFIDRKSVV